MFNSRDWKIISDILLLTFNLFVSNFYRNVECKSCSDVSNWCLCFFKLFNVKLKCLINFIHFHLNCCSVIKLNSTIKSPDECIHQTISTKLLLIYGVVYVLAFFMFFIFKHFFCVSRMKTSSSLNFYFLFFFYQASYLENAFVNFFKFYFN